MRNRSRTCTIAVATLLVAAAAAAPRAGRAQDTASSAAAQQAKPLDDATIVAIFDAANTWDMESGQLAVRRGSTRQVRAFGRMLVRDHQQLRQRGRALAKKLKVTPTPPADTTMLADHHKAMRELRRLNGKAFDRAFVEHEVTFHQAVIKLVSNTLLPATQNEQLRQLQVNVTPAFQAHLAAAERLRSQVAAR